MGRATRLRDPSAVEHAAQNQQQQDGDGPERPQSDPYEGRMIVSSHA
jgi:hypothetical protein